jgi:hypothetical protein
MALRRSARLENKKREEAYRLGEVFMAAARQFWESTGDITLPRSIRRLERIFEAALRKCSPRGQVLVKCHLFDQPIPEGIEDE